MGKFGAQLVALIRRFRQCFGDDRTQSRMNGYIQIPWRNRVLMNNLVNNGGHVLAHKRFFAGGHLVKHHAQAEEVGAAVQGLAFYLLRRHVIGRA